MAHDRKRRAAHPHSLNAPSSIVGPALKSLSGRHKAAQASFYQAAVAHRKQQMGPKGCACCTSTDLFEA